MNKKGDLFRALPFWMTLMVILSVVSMVPGEAIGVQPEFSNVTFDPVPANVSEPLNLTVTFDVFDEPIISVQVQSCIDGICKMPVSMNDVGGGETFYYVFEGGYFGSETVEPYFHFFVDYGDTGSFTYPEDLESKEINITLERRPEHLLINGTADRESMFPGQLITIIGDVYNDLGEQVEGAEVYLHIPGTNITNTTETDMDGYFQIGARIFDEGEFNVNLTASLGDLTGYSIYPISVNSWPMPRITIEGEAQALLEDVPPASRPDTYYFGSNITLTYRIRNTGTGTAKNVSATLEIINGTFHQEVAAGNISISERFEDQLLLPADAVGEHTFRIGAVWDQVAPFDDNFTFPFWTYEYSIVPRPEWTGHRVLLEMFTQTTCGPCVAVEESIEYLYREEEIDMEFVVYVTDDEGSAAVAEGLEITGTPELLFDKDVYRYSGTNGKEKDMDNIRSYVENASELETVPVSIDFLDMENDPTISISLPVEYGDLFSGMLTVSKVESFSNLRNELGIPIANRYMGIHTGYEISDLSSASSMDFTMEPPEESMGLIAYVTSDDGRVMNSASYHPVGEPEVYLEDCGTKLLKLDSPGEGEFNMTLESFHFKEVEPTTHYVSTWTEGLPDGFELSMGDTLIGNDPVNLSFEYDQAVMEVLEVGRIRYSQTHSLGVSVPENVSGNFNFDVMVRSGDNIFSMTQVVIATELDGEDRWPPVVEINDLYLVGEGRNIYFYLEAENVPDNATVIGKLLPCNYEGNERCGIPSEVILKEVEEGLFRASVNSNVVDLSTYTHLNYSARVQVDGQVLARSPDTRTVKISTLIDPGVISDDDDPGDPIDPLLIAISIGALLFALALAVVLFLISRKQPEEEEIEGSDQDVEPGSENVKTQEQGSDEDPAAVPEKNSTDEE
ncbi:MAG: hypothetical protein R6V01_08010 [Thermoplasmatota archaeon]